MTPESPKGLEAVSRPAKAFKVPTAGAQPAVRRLDATVEWLPAEQQRARMVLRHRAARRSDRTGEPSPVPR